MTGAESGEATHRPVVETIESFADWTGLVLSGSAALLLAYSFIGDRLVQHGLLSDTGHFISTVMVFIAAFIVAGATAVLFVHRYKEIKQ